MAEWMETGGKISLPLYRRPIVVRKSMKATEDDGRAHTGDADQVVIVEGMADIGSVVGGERMRINGSASAGEEGARKKVGLRTEPINCLNVLLYWDLQISTASFSLRK